MHGDGTAPTDCKRSECGALSYSLVRRRAVVLLAVSIVASALAISCGDGGQEATVVKQAQPSPTLVAATTDAARTGPALTQTVASPPPSSTPNTTETIPTTTPTPTASPVPSAVPPTLYPTPDFPPPTRHAGGTSWVEERLNAVISLYRPTPAGEALLRSLDLRQMKGEPGTSGVTDSRDGQESGKPSHCRRCTS